MKKKIDERIRVLIENCSKLNQRALVLLVGDRGRDQVATLHGMMMRARVKAKPRVLWCYKKELGFSSHKKKRLKQVKKLQQKGLFDKDVDDPFELFVTSNDVRYCYYKETHKILGNTFGLCVLQDFESVTPNVLCRTVETVEGGGLVILLFNTMTSLRQLYSLTMDAHARFRTEAHGSVEPRFNERFILSLGNCRTCLVMDDELNILPITQSIREIKEVQGGHRENEELKKLQLELKESKPIGNLVGACVTVDQARTVMQIVDSVSEKSMRTTVSLTAGRGRGKSAALGLSIASAIVYGFSNIFVTAPSPENLKTVFEFVFRGLEVLNYNEHQDYEIMESTMAEYKGCVVRVNVYRDHRQTIQYILPQDHQKLAQAELVVIDEAAAIPVTLVKKLLGPYLVLMASTVNGYEGTGRSLSLKLVEELRRNRQGARALKEVKLDEPIRYSQGDPVEKWLNDLLCLQAEVKPLSQGLPHPHECDLYFVDRDTLFSYHSSSEQFLSNLMSIFVSSHYKNSPNDLQMLSDAPAHQVFVLLGPLTGSGLPDILCALLVCFEGAVSKSTIKENLKTGYKPAGDLIPWTVSEQF